MIVAEDVAVHARGTALLDRIGLSLQPGSLTAVVGPNGAGKSTLLAVLAGECAPDGGRVALDGVPLQRWPGRALARRRAVMPQTATLDFAFTVGEVVALGRLPWPDCDPTPALAAVSRRLGLGSLWHRPYTELSGGERQRVQFGRVLAQIHGADEPALLIDEPTSALDLKLRHTVLGIARAEAAGGAAVLAVLHDLDLVSAYADRTILMKRGRIVAEGPTATVLTRAAVADCFDLDDREARLALAS